MQPSYKKIKNLFLSQSCLDSWDDYIRSLRKKNFIRWDYIILTASNEEQAATYREQIAYRREQGYLPRETHYAVLPDPGGKRVGSGGATFHVMRYLSEQEGDRENPFAQRRILVIHSGGDSKRVPQYSALGKLFSPVPRELPDGRGSTLFDEFMIGMAGVPSRIREGMLVLSGDVLLLFNPLQIDFQFEGAAAISIKEHVSTGKNHGVFLNDGQDYVRSFLHKQSEEKLEAVGAVNEQGNVDLDTGAIIFDSNLLAVLFSLISTDGKADEEKFRRFVNEEARISFYGDFLFPLAGDATLEQYYREAPEGTMNAKLLECRKELWEALHSFRMKLLCLSPAEFIHFGTTGELLRLVTVDVNDYEFLGWKRRVVSCGNGREDYAAHNAYVGRKALVHQGAYIEDSYILGESVVGEGSIVSNLRLYDNVIPENVVLHGICLKDGKYVVRIYGVEDNPKGSLASAGSFLGSSLRDFLERNQLSEEDLWTDGQERTLWSANLFPVCETMEEGIDFALLLYRMALGAASSETESWKQKSRMSLYSSFNEADTAGICKWQRDLENRIAARKFIWDLESGAYYKDALQIFGQKGITEDVYRILMQDAKAAGEALQMRIYYAVSQYMKDRNRIFDGQYYDAIEGMCFGTIRTMIYEDAVKRLPDSASYRICREQITIRLPVRVNWGGGWTDTPPYCNEQGGVVLNAAITLRGICPVQVTVRRLEQLHIEFESQDIGVRGTAETVEEIQDCHNPYDSFALHKAALIACGIIPLHGKYNLQEILKRLGGGIYLSTQVVGVPKGSGLGTSSILSGACVKGLFAFLGMELADSRIYDIVLCMEQIMSTGGGWQDQVGGLAPGIKFITTGPGIRQQLQVEPVILSEKAREELQERFALIYTGQRRLARNLLRDVVGNYIGARPESVAALRDMQRVAALMRFELERGNIDEFAHLLSRHWELSRQLDAGSTNTCIDQIFAACDDLTEGKFISGAGGGGFLQVILKKGVTRDDLQQRIRAIFQDSGVDVWDCRLLFD